VNKHEKITRRLAVPPASERGLIIVPDFEMAARFLFWLDPDGIYTFQTLGDGKSKSDRSLTRVFHGTLDQHKNELVRLNALGAGIFVMVNRGDGIIHPGKKTCRTTQNVLEVRALFVDLDGAPLDPVRDGGVHPDVIVESSPGKWHAYWFARDCPLGDFGLRQRQLAEKFQGDHVVHDLPRVMRLPGFVHQKTDPFMSNLIYPE
jgi:hypothetical protein